MAEIETEMDWCLRWVEPQQLEGQSVRTEEPEDMSKAKLV